MNENRGRPGLSMRVAAFIALVGLLGLVWTTYLLRGVEWNASTQGELTLFTTLVVLAGNFPLRVGPAVKTDVTAAALFGAALILEPGVAALVGALGVTIYTVSIRFWGIKYQMPMYKYPFNAGTAVLCVGIASQISHSMNLDGNFLAPSLVLVAMAYYAVNTGLISSVVGLQLGVNPIRFWIKGTQENGPGEASLFAVGILGAVAYHQTPWAIVAVLDPVVITYFAFSRLAGKIQQLEEAETKLQQAKEELEVRVRTRTSDLGNATERSWPSLADVSCTARSSSRRQWPSTCMARFRTASSWRPTGCGQPRTMLPTILPGPPNMWTRQWS